MKKIKTHFMSIKSLFMTMMILTPLMLGSCRHKDFCWDHKYGKVYIDVQYDDDNDPDDIVYLRDKVRATRVLVYHVATDEMVLASDIERRINTLNLGADTYDFIAHNAGTEVLRFDGRDKYITLGTTTGMCDILEPMYGSRGVTSDIDLGNGEDVVKPAEPIWGIGKEAVQSVVGDTIRLTAVPLHCRYTYEMRNVDGLAAVKRMSSFITGMADGASLSNAELYDTPVTVAVPAQKGEDGRSVVGSFFTFGHNPRIDKRHRMGLFIELETGEKYKLLEGDAFDVTEQVVGAANRRRVHIVIDGVRLPVSGTGAGFEVSVNPWGEGENLDVDYVPGGV